jgi:hypothetical protein
MAKPNPSPCCGVSVGCCDNHLPDVLKATITNVSDCVCADGLEIALIFDPIMSVWYGKGPGSSSACALRSDQISLSCSGAGCENLDIDILGICNISSKTMIGDCECDPLHLVYELTIAGLNCCDLLFGGATIRITVTE